MWGSEHLNQLKENIKGRATGNVICLFGGGGRPSFRRPPEKDRDREREQWRWDPVEEVEERQTKS